MSNVISFSITGDTNAEQVVGRAKTAVNGLDNQLGKMSRGFMNGFNSIFLSFLGPMALLGAAMAFVGKMISDNQKKHEDANKAAIENTNALMSAEDKYWANKRNNEKKDKATVAEAKVLREDVTEQFLATDEGQKIIQRGLMDRSISFGQTSTSMSDLARDPKIQAEVQTLIAKDAAASGGLNPAAAGTAFKSPEGFSNVVGVGANPVLDAMNEQLVLLKQANDFLAEIARPSGGGVPIDFTKTQPDNK